MRIATTEGFMSTSQDRQEIDFQDKATSTTGAAETPTDLADSPTVNQPDAEISPAAASAALPDLSGTMVRQDRLDSPLPSVNPSPGATMSERSPGGPPGSPLGQGMGPLPAEAPPGGPLGEPNLSAALAPTDGPQAGGSGVPGHSGVAAGLDETTGTGSLTGGDDTPTRSSRG